MQSITIHDTWIDWDVFGLAVQTIEFPKRRQILRYHAYTQRVDKLRNRECSAVHAIEKESEQQHVTAIATVTAADSATKLLPITDNTL